MASRYRVVKVPMPLEQAKTIMESYQQTRKSPGGMSIRYRMPKVMVARGNETTGAGADESYGMGLGRAMMLPLLMQPRQFAGFENAKSQGKAYNLVLTKAQLDAMKGQGIFKKIADTLVKIAAPLLTTVAGPEAAKAAEEWGLKAVESIDNQITRGKAKKAIKPIVKEFTKQQAKIMSKGGVPTKDQRDALDTLNSAFQADLKDKVNEVRGDGMDEDSSESEYPVCPHCEGSGFLMDALKAVTRKPARRGPPGRPLRGPPKNVQRAPLISM